MPGRLNELSTRAHRRFLTTPMFMRGLVVVAVGVLGGGYLLTHPFPSGAGGLYLQMIKQLSAEGTVPTRIHHYTEHGLPFAYPPLMFIVYSVVHLAFDVSLLALARVMPVLGMGALGLAAFEFVHELYDRRHATVAGVGGVFVVTSPDVLVWNIAAGGMIRAWALAFALVSLLTGLRYLRGDGSTGSLVASGLAFGVVVLSHPQTAAFVVIAQVVAVLAYAPSRQGVLSGLAIGLTGLVVASPWLAYILVTFGPDVLLNAVGSHSDEWMFQPLFDLLLRTRAPVVDLWRAFAFVGAFVLLGERDWYLPVLFGATVLLLGTPRLMMTIGGMLAGITAVRLLESVSATSLPLDPGYSIDVRSALIALVLLYVVVGGSMYAAGITNNSIPQYADEGDATAMAWLQDHTEPTATVVALGDTAEWTPYLSQRTHFFTFWGAEWVGQYDSNRRILLGMSGCRDAECVTRTLERTNERPDYLYVPKNGYGMGAPRTWEQLRRSLTAAPTYHVAHETEAGIVYEIRGESQSDPSPRVAASDQP